MILLKADSLWAYDYILFFVLKFFIQDYSKLTTLYNLKKNVYTGNKSCVAKCIVCPLTLFIVQLFTLFSILY